MIESLVEQIEARYADVQAQMSDPEVIGDRNRLAAAGREFRTLEQAHRLAEQWRRTGGDEAGLWAGDLYRMLTRYAERLGFKTDTMAAADGSYTFEIDGDGAYSV